MIIALIYPARQMGYWPSLGLAYVAAALEQEGHSVHIVDRNPTFMRGGDVDGYTRNSLQAINPDMVGITATTPLMEDVVHILPLVKKECPHSPIVMGGPHVTALPEETLRHYPAVDIVVRQEGELTMPEIAAGRPLEEILGITWRCNGEIRSNPPRPLIADLDSLPFPARHLYDMEFYLHPDNPVIRGLEGIRATHIYNARGCYNKCKFCAGAAVFGRKVRSNSPEKIVAEIQHLIDTYQVEGLYFDEDVFFSTRRRAEAICSALIESGIAKQIKWSGLMRADAAPLDILSLMKEAGCVQVEYGFETGSPRMLELIRKGTTVPQNYEAARNTRKAGLRLLASMVVGFPSETESEFNDTIDFLRNAEPHFIGFNKFVPLPGSQFYEELLAEGKLVGSGNWDVFHVSGSVPHHELISYCAMEGPLFYRKFCESERDFVHELNMVGIIASLLETLDDLENGFDLSSVRLKAFPLAIDNGEEEDAAWYREQVLSSLDAEKPFEPEAIGRSSKVSAQTRMAVLNNVGIDLMADFRLVAAVSCLEAARRETDHPLISANLGICAFRRKAFSQAENYFTSALSKSGRYQKGITWDAITTWLLRGRLDTAKERYEQFDKEFTCTDGLMGRAACHLLEGDWDQALRCWEKALAGGDRPVARQNIEAVRLLRSRGGRIVGFKPLTDFTYF